MIIFRYTQTLHHNIYIIIIIAIVTIIMIKWKQVEGYQSLSASRATGLLLGSWRSVGRSEGARSTINACKSSSHATQCSLGNVSRRVCNFSERDFAGGTEQDVPEWWLWTMLNRELPPQHRAAAAYKGRPSSTKSFNWIGPPAALFFPCVAFHSCQQSESIDLVFI